MLADFAGLDDRQQGERVVCASSAQPDFSPPSLEQQDDGLHKGKSLYSQGSFSSQLTGQVRSSPRNRFGQRPRTAELSGVLMARLEIERKKKP